MSSFSDFVKFISEDPVMLGLCGAIIFLVLVFIIVLLFGGRKKDSENKEVLDNTSSLLKDSINEEPLRSTQEFALNNLEETQKVSSVEEIVDKEFEKTVPISLNEVMSLKAEREESDVKDTIQIPVINEEKPVELEIPKMQEDMSLPIMEETKIESINATQPFSSVVVNSGDELPKVEENLSNTEIIRHVPTDEIKVEEENEEVSLDDIDLPKLNTNESTSVLNSLSGESFKL